MSPDRSRRVQVTMSDEFHAALVAFAVEQECSSASLLLRAAKAYLSQHRRWSQKTQARPVPHVRKHADSEVRE